MSPQSPAIPDEVDPKAGFHFAPSLPEEVHSTLSSEVDTLDRLAAFSPGISSPFLLLVDDDDHDAFFFKNALRAASVRIRMSRVKDGQEAIDYLQGRNEFADREQFPLPQIALLDVKMPRRNGLEVLKFIRASPELEKTLVVILTSSADERTIQEIRRLRIAAYLIKPSKVSHLIDIAHHLEILWLETIVQF